jgi:carbon-monoxide dehydrogenase medium subunit
VARRAGVGGFVAAGAALGMLGATIADAGIALAAVGSTTVHVARAEDALRGQSPSEELFGRAAAMASEDCSPAADQRGPIDYKRHLARELTHRALRRAAARALHEET